MRETRAHTHDVRDRVQRPHLVEVDVERVAAVDGGLGDGVSVPSIVPIRAGGEASGNDWIGLRTTNDSVLKSVSRVPLFGGFLGLGLLLLAMGSMWYREGR